MLDALLNILNGFTDIPFVELAWSHSPDNKYGVITLDNQIPLNADADPVSEKMLTGFVDVFVKKPKDLSTVSDVESALKRLGIYFALNSVQFEDDTGYVHYEWVWRDDVAKTVIAYYNIEFYDDDGGILGNESVLINTMPTIPDVDDYEENGIHYNFVGWKPEVTVAKKDQRYDATYFIVLEINASGDVVNVDEMPFSMEQIYVIERQFNDGATVKAYYLPTEQWLTVDDLTLHHVVINGEWYKWA